MARQAADLVHQIERRNAQHDAGGLRKRRQLLLPQLLTQVDDLRADGFQPQLTGRRLFEGDALKVLCRHAGVEEAVGQRQAAEVNAVLLQEIQESAFDGAAGFRKVAAIHI